MKLLGLTEEQLENYHEEEAEYFQSLRQEPEWDVHAVVYVELLQELRNLEYAAFASLLVPTDNFP